MKWRPKVCCRAHPPLGLYRECTPRASIVLRRAHSSPCGRSESRGKLSRPSGRGNCCENGRKLTRHGCLNCAALCPMVQMTTLPYHPPCASRRFDFLGSTCQLQCHLLISWTATLPLWAAYHSFRIHVHLVHVANYCLASHPHNTMFLSLDTVRKPPPEVFQAHAVTSRVCSPSNALTNEPVWASHTTTEPSTEPHTKYAPFGEYDAWHPLGPTRKESWVKI
mmetsp:Transcript_32845/g.85975  ORF Transcript_32845/g.85975 Transcript_32845/m.85975 type:complete len:222 (+) Transcript_32845:1339-2004(+)